MTFLQHKNQWFPASLSRYFLGQIEIAGNLMRCILTHEKGTISWDMCVPLQVTECLVYILASEYTSLSYCNCVPQAAESFPRTDDFSYSSETSNDPNH